MHIYQGAITLDDKCSVMWQAVHLLGKFSKYYAYQKHNDQVQWLRLNWAIVRIGNEFIGSVQGLKLSYLYIYSRLCYLELSMIFYYITHVAQPWRVKHPWCTSWGCCGLPYISMSELFSSYSNTPPQATSIPRLPGTEHVLGTLKNEQDRIGTR